MTNLFRYADFLLYLATCLLPNPSADASTMTHSDTTCIPPTAAAAAVAAAAGGGSQLLMHSCTPEHKTNLLQMLAQSHLIATKHG